MRAIALMFLGGVLYGQQPFTMAEASIVDSRTAMEQKRVTSRGWCRTRPRSSLFRRVFIPSLRRLGLALPERHAASPGCSKSPTRLNAQPNVASRRLRPSSL